MFGRNSGGGDKKEARAEKAIKAAKKADDKAEKAIKKEPVGLIGTLTNPKTAKRAVAVARIAGPAVAPFALKAATTTRGFLDERRAIKLGVTAEEVSAYRGPTGPAGARVASLRSAIDELRGRRATDMQVTRFSDAAKARLSDLAIAVHTAAAMPGTRRRSTLAAVNKELNKIEADLMTYLVGSPV